MGCMPYLGDKLLWAGVLKCCSRMQLLAEGRQETGVVFRVFGCRILGVSDVMTLGLWGLQESVAHFSRKAFRL